MSLPHRLKRGCIIPALKAYGIFVGLLIAVPLASSYLYAWWRLPREERAWASIGRPLDALPRRFARTEANQSARRLDALARPLGLRFLEPGSQSEELKAFWAYLAEHETAEAEGVRPLPPALRRILNEHARDIFAIEELLLGPDDVAWAMDLERGFEPPIPPLLPYRHLQSLLLAKALDASRQGQPEAAQRALEASWRLGQSVTGRPEMISHLILLITVQLQDAVLRCLPEAPRDWMERRAASGLGEGYLAALQVETYLFAHFGRGFRGVADVASVEAGASPPTGPANFLVRLFSAPYLKLSVASYSAQMRRIVTEIERADRCLLDAGAISKQATEALPRWNIIGRIAMPSLFAAVTSTAIADLDAEMTWLTLQARFAASLRTSEPQLVPSQVCSSVIWRVRHLPDGTSTIEAQGDKLPPRAAKAPWRFRVERSR